MDRLHEYCRHSSVEEWRHALRCDHADRVTLLPHSPCRADGDDEEGSDDGSGGLLAVLVMAVGVVIITTGVQMQV